MTSYATVQDNANCISPPPNREEPTDSAYTTHAHPLVDSSLSACVKAVKTPSTPGGCDVDSFSESEREKMDTTPENIKKIDDIIRSADLSSDSEHKQTTNEASITKFHLARPALCSFRSKETIARNNASNTSKHLMNAENETEKTATAKEEDDDDEEEEKNSNCASTAVDEKEIIVTRPYTQTHATNDDRDDDESVSSNSIATMMASTKQSCAFTIDHFNDKECDAVAQAAKYKSMMERFQNRHRRGASLSKLENDDSLQKPQTPTRFTSSQSSTPLTGRTSARSSLLMEENNNNASSPNTHTSSSTAQKVKVRVRERSTSRVRDASKRHSWSPRSSAHELQQQQQESNNSTTLPMSTNNAYMSTNSRKSAKKSGAHSRTTPQQLPKGASTMMANRTRFAPRSTAMQLALQQVDFMCPQPPLTEFKHMDADADDISETGTYTLDGDNYTEEQKDLMNIDKNAKSNGNRTTSRRKQLQSSTASKRGNNVLEVNYFHDADTIEESKSNRSKDLIIRGHHTADAYLEKIKSRVLRNMNSNQSMENKLNIIKQKLTTAADEEVNADLGCITSVTTSGVLAKQRTLDACPKLSRKGGLSTSQIDSSEYVSNETKLKSSGTPSALAGGFTDHQKAEYRLNVFTNQKDTTQKKFAATRNLIETPPETPTDNVATSATSEVAVLQTAQTKHDWIQEWARNARARSLANDRYTSSACKQSIHDALMTRSYTCADTGNDSLTDDSLYSGVGDGRQKAHATKLNRTLAERFGLPGSTAVECDYASDSTLFTSSNTKPPKSPTKIPSPLHSLGRTRSGSRTGASMHNMFLQDDNDYLQQTAAAINNLQQSLSRKNSLKSPSHSASPRAHSARSHIMYSPDGTNIECSPQHSATTHQRHRSAMPSASLMTSSINEQQLQLLTSGEYLMRQMRLRKNSFDGNMGCNGTSGGSASPQRFAKQKMMTEQGLTPNSSSLEGDPCLTPLRRSSSFTARMAASQKNNNNNNNNNSRPNMQNLYTPPSARHDYTMYVAHVSQKNAIKKSASSNTFDQTTYSDYDDNLQYYVNDEDDVEDAGEEYFSSGGEENNIESEYFPLQSPEEEDMPEVCAPLSNTRYNKALLMRIERSKQKVTGGGGRSGGKPHSAPLLNKNPAVLAAGVIACPNTPELPRRNVKSATTRPGASTARQSMPRDTSLSRLAQQVPNSLASAKKQLLQTAANVTSNTVTRSSSGQRAQPRYLDISKYKPVQSNQFLRKNDAKSTLKQTTADVMKRSPSSSSMGIARTDPSRCSNRSVRSVSSVMTTSGTNLGGSRASSAVRRDPSVSKQKQIEMAMWKRRSKYDPMKAAAEDKRKREEAKRLAQAQQLDVPDTPIESEQQQHSHWPSIGETVDYNEDDCF